MRVQRGRTKWLGLSLLGHDDSLWWEGEDHLEVVGADPVYARDELQLLGFQRPAVVGDGEGVKEEAEVPGHDVQVDDGDGLPAQVAHRGPHPAPLLPQTGHVPRG